MRKQFRLGLTFLTVAIALCCGSLAYALTTVQQMVLWQQSAVHDGISLNFATGIHYVKAPGQAAQYGAFNSLFNFTRNSVGTYRAQSGNIVYANENTSFYSTDASQVSGISYWHDVSAGTTTRTAGQNDPINGTAAVKLNGNNGNTWWVDSTSLDDISTPHPGIPITVSVWLRADSSISIAQKCAINGGTTQSNSVNLTTAWTQYVWTFVSVQGTAGSGMSCGVNIGNAQNVYIWGQQVQRGSAAGPLLVTTTAAKYDQPRIEYDASGNALGLLVEGSRTNRALWSNDMTNAAWVAVTMTTAQTATGPDGVANSATTLTATAGNGTMLQAFVEAAVDSDYCTWIKRRTGSGNIDLTEDTGATWLTVAVTSTWTKFCAAHQSFLNPNIGIRIVTNGDAVDVWGNQLEAGAFGTSTIPTTTVAVTRAADASVRTFGAEYVKTRGTTFVELDRINAAAAGVGIFGSGDAARNAYITAAGGAKFGIYDGTTECGSGGAGSFTSNVMSKGAAAFDAGGMAVSFDTAALVTCAFDGTFGAAETTINVGDTAVGANAQLFGHIRRLEYWPVRQPNDFLQRKTLPGPMSALEPANDNDRRAYG